MAKYTEAYNDITNRNIDIMHVRKECSIKSNYTNI